MDKTFFDPLTNDDFFEGIDDEIAALSATMFSLKIKEGGGFLRAIKGLYGMDFDNKNLALVSVGCDGKGLEVTVRNSETGLTGYLQLSRDSLTEFECNKPFSKTIFLNEINDCFVHSSASMDDPITIYYVQGNKAMYIKFGGSVSYAINVYEVSGVAFEKYPYPDFVKVGSSSFKTVGLRNILFLLSTWNEPEQVTLDITDQGLIISIRNKRFTYKEVHVTQLNMAHLKGIRTALTIPHHGSLAHASGFACHGTVSIPQDKHSPDSLIFEFEGDDMLIAYIIRPVLVFLNFNSHP